MLRNPSMQAALYGIFQGDARLALHEVMAERR
jgi:hypothetical protein